MEYVREKEPDKLEAKADDHVPQEIEDVPHGKTINTYLVEIHPDPVVVDTVIWRRHVCRSFVIRRWFVLLHVRPGYLLFRFCHQIAKYTIRACPYLQPQGVLAGAAATKQSV